MGDTVGAVRSPCQLPQALKAHRSGTHRWVPPSETLARVRPFLSVMGITRVANVTGLDSIGIPVTMVCRPNSRSLAVSQGKGLTIEAARASGLMESVESYHGEHVALPLKYCSYEELRYTHRVVDVDRLPRITQSIFHPNLQLLWIEGYQLLGGQGTWVPYEIVHTNFTLPLPVGSGCFTLSSNGLASGNHVLEAILHGLCEVIERDSTALWLASDAASQRSRRVDLHSIDDGDCRAVVDRYEAAGIDVAVWDTTTDIGVPAFACTITERDPNPLRSLYTTSGMGCHPVRSIALLRALTEAAQSRLTFIVGSRDDATRQRYLWSRDPETLGAQRAALSDHLPCRSFLTAPDFQSDSFDADLAWVLGRLQTVGISSVIVVDLTRSEFHIPVVRVIVPGLEGSRDVPAIAPGPRAYARAGNFP